MKKRFPLRLACLSLFTIVVCVGVAAVGGLAAASNVAECPATNRIDALAMRFTLLISGESLNATAGQDATPLKFTVRADESVADIAQNLAQQKLIADDKLFSSYVRFCGFGNKLQAGIFLLNQAQTIPQIAQALTQAGASEIAFRVLEGWRIEQIAEAIDKTPLLSFSGTDFKALVGPGAHPPDWFTQVVKIPSGASLEGFLFPDTYQLSLDDTAANLRDKMLRNFLARVTPDMRNAASAEGLTLYQAITLASIVEREAVVDDERPVIASVYLNRLHNSMTFDADPTIQYALGDTRTPGNWWPQITQDDYQGVASPYNTYLHPGFPPSPIANPGLASIQGALQPSQTNYLYFRATCTGDGHHKFATTFAEQQANGC